MRPVLVETHAMSTVIPDPASLPPFGKGHLLITISERASIPPWVVDLDSFRRWARSSEYPETGCFSYLAGELWVDLSMEEFFTHNQVKTGYTVVLGHLAQTADLGYFIADRMRITHPGAELSTEPDAAFAFWETLRSGRLKLIAGTEGFIELEGTPDMALEIVSASSIRKDTKTLRELYWKAGVPEYWLVDVRNALRFEILRHTPEDYVAVPETDGWIRSEVFNKSFKLTQTTDPLGHPKFTLSVQ